MQPVLRLMTEDNQSALMAVQHDAYKPYLSESWDVFLNKLRLYPDGCWICTVGDNLVAYLFSHPSEYANPPALNREIGNLPERPDCVYIHDLAILKAYHGKRIGQLLCAKAVEIAMTENFPQMALTAVQQSQSFWAKNGFSPAELSSELALKLHTYGKDAIYMSRKL